RHHHRLAALHHAAGDALADLVTRPPRGLGIDAAGGLHRQLAGALFEEHDPAAEGPMVLLEDLQHASQGGLQVEGRGQRAAQLEQVRELADLGRVRALRLACPYPRHGIGAHLLDSFKIVTASLLSLLVFAPGYTRRWAFSRVGHSFPLRLSDERSKNQAVRT